MVKLNLCLRSLGVRGEFPRGCASSAFSFRMQCRENGRIEITSSTNETQLQSLFINLLRELLSEMRGSSETNRAKRSESDRVISQVN